MSPRGDALYAVGAGHRAGAEGVPLRAQLLESVLSASTDALSPHLLVQGVMALLGLPAQQDEHAAGRKHWLDTAEADQLNQKLQHLVRGASTWDEAPGHTRDAHFSGRCALQRSCVLQTRWILSSAAAGEDFVRQQSQRSEESAAGQHAQRDSTAQMPGSMLCKLQRLAAGGLTGCLERACQHMREGVAAAPDAARLQRLMGLCDTALRCRAALLASAQGQPGRLDPAWAPSGSVVGKQRTVRAHVTLLLDTLAPASFVHFLSQKYIKNLWNKTQASLLTGLLALLTAVPLAASTGALVPAVKQCGTSLLAVLDSKSSVTAGTLSAVEGLAGALVLTQDAKDLSRCGANDGTHKIQGRCMTARVAEELESVHVGGSKHA